MLEYSTMESMFLDQYALDAMDEMALLELAGKAFYDSDDDEQRNDNEGNRDLSTIRLIVEKGGVDPETASDMLGWSLLHRASHGGDLDVLKYLVDERRVNVESVEDEEQKNTALHCACQGGSLPAIKYLVEHAKANLNARNYKQWTPLHFACFEGHLDVVQYLVEEQRMNPRAMSNSGSPLHAASYWMRYEVIRYLLPYSVVDEKALKLIWDAEPSWNFKQRLLDNYVQHHHLKDGIHYLRRYPLHMALQCPLPSNDAFLDCLNHYGTEWLKTMDEQGKLPLHTALNAAAGGSTTTTTFMTPTIIRQLFELEPRAATIKDATTGWYPHETAAAIAGSKNEDEWFSILYELLRANDPVAVLGRRVSCCEDEATKHTNIMEEETTSCEETGAVATRTTTRGRRKKFSSFSWLKRKKKKPSMMAKRERDEIQ